MRKTYSALIFFFFLLLLLSSNASAQTSSVVLVEITDTIDQSTVEVMTDSLKQAEAEREKRSRIIMAEGELLASAKMTEAAKLYEITPIALRLRELQTLTEIAREKNLIIVPGGEIGTMAGIAKAVNKKTEQ